MAQIDSSGKNTLADLPEETMLHALDKQLLVVLTVLPIVAYPFLPSAGRLGIRCEIVLIWSCLLSALIINTVAWTAADGPIISRRIGWHPSHLLFRDDPRPRYHRFITRQVPWWLWLPENGAAEDFGPGFSVALAIVAIRISNDAVAKSTAVLVSCLACARPLASALSRGRRLASPKPST
ncbi:hypothetical protein A9K55_007162 [Cordyceps militaris]|uniref:Uncharacterized protein n=1 Tax=Cordyceps militaris TaxID=73501 RepID=A0A2H4SH81_CORMI|nr:hypothetical protein A9K55_007162 [Cordyceps militaris]